MKNSIVRLLWSAYIFLCATFSTNAQQPAIGEWDREALRLEREIYAATSPVAHNAAVMAKCNVRKQQGLHKEALAEMARIYTYALDNEQLALYYNNKALCSYLAGLFDDALAAIDEARLYLPTEAHTPLLLYEALAAGERGDWERSHSAALQWLQAQPHITPAHIAQIEEIYASTPRLRNPQLAWWLSLIPGVGQLYAGEVGSAIVSMVVNGALGGFAVSEVLGGQWLGGWIVGGGLLSNTYFVGQERARILTERRNARLLRNHNDLLRATLLQQ